MVLETIRPPSPPQPPSLSLSLLRHHETPTTRSMIPSLVLVTLSSASRHETPSTSRLDLQSMANGHESLAIGREVELRLEIVSDVFAVTSCFSDTYLLHLDSPRSFTPSSSRPPNRRLYYMIPKPRDPLHDHPLTRSICTAAAIRLRCSLHAARHSPRPRLNT